MNAKKGGLSKAAKGVAFGDVSNAAIRNVLSEISKQLFEEFTELDMENTMEQFGWLCPYTGKDLKDEYEKRTGNYATDHIYPQNKEWCGLNVKGNLVLVDKNANNAKKGLDVETFLGKDSKFCKENGIDDATRTARLLAIKAFQSHEGYEPTKIRDTVRAILEKRYSEVRKNQEDCIKEVETALVGAGIGSARKTAAGTSPTKTVTKGGKGARRKYPEDVVYQEAAYYLRHNVGLPAVEEAVLGRNNGGSSAIGHLNKLGIDTSLASKHKGMLIHTNIEDAIAHAAEPKFKATLEEIKKRNL